MRILAIESTCDETGACVAETFGDGVRIISETKATSAEITSKYGGIVPEVVAREQVAAIVPVLMETMDNGQWTIESLDGVAVSYGPGLVGSLLIGIETAKSLAWAWNKKLYGVNHMVGHVFSNWIIESHQQSAISSQVVPEMPAVALVVSGGHTDLVLLKTLTDWQWIGGTRDDAVGEAFDKVARVMGLPYPGGPAIAKLAAEFSAVSSQQSAKVKLPRPMINEPGLEMSFSGLKTAVMQRVAETEPHFAKATDGSSRADFIRELSRDFNNAVVDVLVNKTVRAIEAYRPRSVVLAGGVAANQLLREQLSVSCQLSAVNFFMPELKYTTDNAAMIAAAALMRPVEMEPLHLRPEPSLGVV